MQVWSHGSDSLDTGRNLAEWAAAAGATGAILWGVISWSRDRAFQAADRRREIELIESEQARKVGFALSPKARDSDVYLATVYNTSELPIRKVNVMAAARIVQDEKDVDAAIISFPPIPIIAGKSNHTEEASPQLTRSRSGDPDPYPDAEISWMIAVDLEDNDGTLWSKHEGAPVKKNLRGGTWMRASLPPTLD